MGKLAESDWTMWSAKNWLRLLVAAPMVLLPVLLGGARPWLWSMVAGTFMLGVVISLWLKRGSFMMETHAKGWSLLLGLLLLYPLLQIVPLPLPWVGFLSPVKLNWLRVSTGISQLLNFDNAVSYDPLASVFSWLWWIFLIVYTLLFQKILKAEKSLDWLFWLLFVFAGFEAVYGLLQVLIPSLRVFWESDGSGFATGTFVNRNHYAAFVGMIWPLLLGYLFSISQGVEGKRALSIAERTKQRQIFQKQLFFGLIIGLVLLSLFFSHSRGGILSALIAFTVFVVFGRARRKRLLLVSLGCWMVMIGYGSIIGFEEILTRFTQISASVPGRIKIWQDTWKMIQDHALTGTGLGTYATVFRLYQSHFSDVMRASHAHSDYLQLAAELGLPMAGVMVASVWGYWCRAARRAWGHQGRNHNPLRAAGEHAAMKVRRESVPRFEKSGRDRRGTERMEKLSSKESQERDMIALGALAGSAAFLCHSWVDFNWQIPANQVYFIILLMLLQGSNLSPERVPRQATKSSPQRTFSNPFPELHFEGCHQTSKTS